MNKKTKIFIIVLLIVFVLTLIVNLISNLNYDKKIEKYIVNLGFDNNDNSYLYSKQTSEHNYEEYIKNIGQGIETEYEVLYFNTSTYQLTKDRASCSNNIIKNLTSTFDYTNNSLTYIYRINFNSTNIILEGKFDKKTEEFTCEPTFFYQINMDDSKDIICDKVKYEVKNFQNEATTLFENSKILQYMNKN